MASNDFWDEADIPALLQLGRAGEGRFVSHSHDLNQQNRVFGGQLLGQAAVAASHHAEGRTPTYLGALFLRGAEGGHPIEYAVEPLQRGKRFSSFRVRGTQIDRPVIDVHVSFQTPEQGLEHTTRLQREMPAPEACRTMGALQQQYQRELAAQNYQLTEKSTIEARFIDPEDFLFKRATDWTLAYWVRPRSTVPADAMQQALATIYLSDYYVGFCGVMGHRPMVGARDEIYVASLNHAIWLHGQSKPGEWLLFMTDSPHASSGRGLSNGRIYGEDGRLLASLTQEMSVVEKAA